MFIFLATLAACASTPSSDQSTETDGTASASADLTSAAAYTADHEDAGPKADPAAVFGAATPKPAMGLEVAIFAGGCFWCVEKPFDHLQGVIATTSGYTDGPEINPTYEEVGGHRTGHTEALRVVYDPTVVSYARLLDVFWHNIDPTQENGQFCDKGSQYRTGIYTSDPVEKALAEASKAAVAAKLGKAVATEIDPVSPFWPAEEYHQDFYDKNPGHYISYRTGCRRDHRLKELWGAAAVDGAGAAWIEALDGSGDAGEAMPTQDAALDTLAPPFSPEQIRDAFPEGRHVVFAMTSPKGTTLNDWKVTGADQGAVTINFTTLDEAGAVLEGPKEETSSWEQLRDHAVFSKASTTRKATTVTALGVQRPGWQYTRTEDKAGQQVVTHFHFAQDLPGPPVEMVMEHDGMEVMRMKMLTRE